MYDHGKHGIHGKEEQLSKKLEDYHYDFLTKGI